MISSAGYRTRPGHTVCSRTSSSLQKPVPY